MSGSSAINHDSVPHLCTPKKCPLDWFASTKDITVSYGCVKSTKSAKNDVTSKTCVGDCACCEVLQLRGNYEAVNMGGYVFTIKHSRPVFEDRLTYSLGLVQTDDKDEVKLDCDGSIVKIYGSQGEDPLILRMETESKETNKITYCKPKDGKVIWINFNFPQDEE